MHTLYLLLLLSQNGAGDINASFVNSDSLEQCRQSMALVEGIFSARKIPMLYRGCMPSPLRFTPFAHSDTSNVTRYHYLITVDGAQFNVEPLQSRTDCMERRRRSDSERVYCASSIQRIIE